MVHISEVDRQLKAIGVTIKYWGRAEVAELRNILMDGEKIKGCLNGRYEGGFAMLCATDQRLLLVDKKPMYLSVEDLRYDMVAEVDFHNRLLDSTICVNTPNKQLVFTAFKQKPLRDMANYVQQRVMEFRQQHMMQDMVQPFGAQMSQMTAMSAASTQPAQPAQATQTTQTVQDPVMGTTNIMDDVDLSYQDTPGALATHQLVSHPPIGQPSLAQPIQFRMTNPYTNSPLMMRRRVGRFSS